MRILLIEDNFGDMVLIREILKTENISLELDYAEKLAAGLKLLDKSRPDVVLLDLLLPDSYGLETFEKINALAPQIPIIILTGNDDEATALSAVKMGAQDYLVKGRLDGDYLLRAMRYAIERKQSEEKLLEITDRLNLALTAAKMGTWSWHNNDTVIQWDKHMYALFGINSVQPIDQQYVYKQQQEMIFKITKFLQKTTKQDIEWQIIWPDESTHLLAIRGRAFINEQQKITKITGVCWDITETKHAENLLMQHRQEIAQAERINSMGQMGLAIAHELNQPLTAITTYTQGCIRGLQSGLYPTDAIIDKMQLVAQQSERAGKIVHRMKDFVQQGKLSYEDSKINDLINHCIFLFDHELQKNAINLVCNLADNLPIIKLDIVQIQQVLINLFRNAAEAMETAKINKPTLTIKTEQTANKYIIISVIDNGPGFKNDILNNLFNPYFTTKPRGMGIGLAICRTIVEAHGGQLSANQNDTGGACLKLTLPTHS